jgi:hypothetical protein
MLFTGARMMRIWAKDSNRPNGVRRCLLIANWFRVEAEGAFTLKPSLVPPNADRNARFQVQFLEDVLHVLLHGAGAALENLADLAVALSGCNPFYHFKLALR